MASATTRSAVAGLALLGAGFLAGCNFATPITTLVPYAPSDGVRVDLTRAVSIENLMILTDGEGEVDHLVGLIVNNGLEDAEVLIQVGADGAPFPFEIPARSQLQLEQAGIAIDSSPSVPGTNVEAIINGPEGSSDVAAVPVLDGTIPPYDEFLENAPESATESATESSS